MKTIFIIIPFFFIGCVNKKGISLNYYPNCYEYYDYYGVYHQKCENNVYNFKKKKEEEFKEAPICLDCN